MKFKKTMALIVVSFLMFSLISACGTNTSSPTETTAAVPTSEQGTTAPAQTAPAEKVRITYLYQTSGDQAKKSIIDKMINMAKDLVKDEVVVEETDIGNTQMNQYLRMKAAAGDLQDVLSGSAVESGLGMSGYVMELPQELQDMSTIPDQGKAKDGKMYNLPSSVMPWSIVYNKELFEKAGITSVPKTWNELLDDCEALKSQGIPPFIFMLKGDEAYATGFLLLQFFSAEVLSKNPNWTVDRYNGKVKFDCPEWRTIFDKIRTLIEKGYVEKNALSYTSASGQEAMAQGKAAMIGMPQATIATLQQSTDYHFNAFPLPNDTDASIVTTSSDTGPCLRAGLEGDKLAAAIKFVKALYSPEPYKLLLDYSVSPSVIKGFTYVPKAPNDVVKGMIEDMANAVASNDTIKVQTFGGNGGYTWYDAWNTSYNIIAEMYAGKKLTNDEIMKRLDNAYQKGYENEKKAEQNASESSN